MRIIVQNNSILARVFTLLLLSKGYYGHTICGKSLQHITDNQLCCDEQIYDRYVNGTNLDCCQIQEVGREETQSIVYDKNRMLCCAGRLISLPSSRGSSDRFPVCCGAEILQDTLDGFCCNGRAYQGSHQQSYCCGQSIPAGLDDLCCYVPGKPAKVYSRAWQNMRCCGTVAYTFPGDQQCFLDELYPSDKILGLCGQRQLMYDKNQYVCCQETGTLLDIIQHPNKGLYVNITPNLGCFNEQVVDLDKYKIVEDYMQTKRLIPKPFEICGENIYYPQPQQQALCCDGELFIGEKDSVMQCCGKTWYNSAINVCCSEKILPHDQLCCGLRNPYNRTDAEIECCGSQLIMHKEYLCCKLQSSKHIPVRKAKAVDNMCCGATTYHSLENKICHHGQLISLKSLQNEEQNEAKGYKPRKQVRSRHGDCVSCVIRNKLEPCVKKFVYQLVITKVFRKRKSTTIQAVMKPWTMVTLTTNQRCRCFKTGQIYQLYTNRNYMDKISKGMKKLKYSKKDVLVKFAEDKLQMHPPHGCTVDRWLKSNID